MITNHTGGVPTVERLTVDTTGYEHPLRARARRTRSGGQQVGVYGVNTFYLQATNLGANEIRIYFAETDFTADANFLVLPAPSSAGAREEGSQWEGPASLKTIWVRSVTGSTTLELVNFQRFG